MFVTEFGQGLTSRDLNQQLQNVYDWSLNLEEMNDGHVNSVLSSMKTKLRSIKESSQGHFAERNPNYMEALLVTRVLEAVLSEREAQQLIERKLKQAEMNKREKYVKGMKKVKGDFDKRYGDRGEEVMYATATKMAKKESVEEAMDILKSVLAGNMTLLEGEFDTAAAIVAARDMVDTMQDMVEKLSGMLNKDLPALVDVMRDQVGQSQADAFNQAAQSALNPLMDQARNAKSALDNAARAAAGSEGAAPMEPGLGAEPVPPMGGPAGGLNILPPGEEEAGAETADTAAGGTANLGRGKRS
jgi:transposase